ncbi:hypothetical protein [Pseudooceanicola sp.]|uniref:hypothetical protein n=1 Tax=Pseudooceanicola sp. TaxID=1914328 RepID=UPI0035C76286
MPLQLLCQLTSTDTAATLAALTADTEDQALAGLTRLQLWTEDTTAVWALFEVNDRAKAEGWLTRATADTHGRPSQVTASTAHFLATA